VEIQDKKKSSNRETDDVHESEGLAVIREDRKNIGGSHMHGPRLWKHIG